MLDDSAELDIFISNAKYSEFLNCVTHDEHRMASLTYKYNGVQLIETLEKFLMAPNSPQLAKQRAKSPPKLANKKPFIPHQSPHH